MPVKKAATPQPHAEVFDKFMAINSDLHAIMSNLIAQSEITEDVASVPASLVKDAYNVISEALELMKPIDQIKNYTQRVELWSNGLKKVIDTIPEEDGKLNMPAIKLSELVGGGWWAGIINQITNLIHNAAHSIVAIAGELKGCNVSSYKPDEAIFVSKYCGGLLPNISGKALVHEIPLQHITIEGKKKVLSFPTQIEHFLGLHWVKPSSQTIDDKINIALEYHDSAPSYPGAANRQRGVRERLELEGLECHIGQAAGLKYSATHPLYCWGEMDPDTIRTMATFMSLIRDADLPHSYATTDAHEIVRDKAWQIAQKVNQQYGDNAWQSGQPKPNWGALFTEWQQDKELYKKKVIYEDLRDLLIVRDKHHAIETKYGLDANKVSMPGIKEIVANANEAIKIIKKNKWSAHGIPSNVASLENIIASGKAMAITGTSDAIGHVLHDIITAKLSAEGTYGGCSMKGNILNISAGNLAYCEGVLKGTDTTTLHSGNEMNHKVLPLTYKTYIGDEHLHEGYNVVLHLPADGGWAAWLQTYLKAVGMDCTAQTCHIDTFDLDYIRKLALFLSNLRGADEKIGEECSKKALTLADGAATDQNTKGVFAFTQEPIMPNTKAWIDICHKQYGILPPGLTEEEKVILQLIGPNKIYGGCSFAQSEVIPNMGYITYCEGVRKNPTANINAILDPQGILDHYFHGKPGEADLVAKVNILREGDLYHVEFPTLSLYGKELLRKEVRDRLKDHWAFKCPTPTSCSTTTPLAKNDVRFIAAFLSSLHQIYKLSPECAKAAVDYALQQASKLPANLDAHDSIVYPFETPDWNKVVCSKIEGVPAPPTEVEAAPPVEKPKKVTNGYIMSQIKAGKPPFKVGGCLSTTAKKPTKVKAAYCSGVLDKFIFEDEIKDLVNVAALTPTENWHQVTGDGKIVFDSKYKVLYITLPQELMAIPEIVGTLKDKYGMTQNDNTFSKSIWSLKAASRVALFFSRLAAITLLPPDCHAKAVEHAYSEASKEELTPIYPFDVSSWMKEVCVEKAEAKSLTDLTTIEMIAVHDFMKEEKLKGNEFVLHATSEKFNLKKDQIMLKSYEMIVEEITAEGKPPGVKPTLNPTELKDQIVSIMQNAPDNKTEYGSLVNAILEYYDVKSGPAFEEGTIAWAVDKLKEEGILAFYGGTVYGLAEKPEAKPKPTVDELKEAILKFLQPKSPAEWHSYNDIVSWLKAQYKDVTEAQIANALNELAAAGIIELEPPDGYKLVEKPKKVYSDLDPMAQGKIGFEAVDLLKKGLTAPDVATQLALKYNFIFDEFFLSALKKAIDIAVEEGIKPSLDELIHQAHVKIGKLYDKLTKEQLEKMQVIYEYKKLPKAIKDWLHGVMNLRLLTGYKEGKPYDEILKGLEEDIIHHALSPIPITPLMVKLQTDLEKKRKVRRGELPAEPGEKVEKHYEGLSDEEQAAINEKIQELIKEGKDWDAVIGEIEKEFGIETSAVLSSTIATQSHGLEEEKPTEIITKIEQLPQNIKDGIDIHIQGRFKQGATAEGITEEIASQSPYIAESNISGSTILDYVIQKMGEYAVEKPSIDMETFGWLPPFETFLYQNFSWQVPKAHMVKLVEAGISKKEIILLLTTKSAGDFGSLSGDAAKAIVDLYMPEEMEEEVYLHYSELPKAKQEEIDEIAYEGVQEGKSPQEIKELIEMQHPELEWDEDLDKVIESAFEIMVEKEEEKTHLTHSELLQWLQTYLVDHPGIKFTAQELHTILGKHPKYESPGIIPVGDALTELAEAATITANLIEKPNLFWYSAVPMAEEKPLSKKVKKLYGIYKPEVAEAVPYDIIKPHLKEYLRGLAAKMLAQGKSQEDTAWYISYNYAIEKASVKPMVKKEAEKPISVEAAVEAFKILGIGEKIGGCVVEDEMGNLMPQNVAYCQGVLNQQGHLIGKGQAVTHKMPSSEANVGTTIEDNAWKADIRYSPIEKSEFITPEVAKILGEMSFNCKLMDHTVVACDLRGSDAMTLPINDQDKLRQSAIFLSKIDNVGKLDPQCIPYALKYAFEQAKNISQTSQPWSVNVYPKEVKEWQAVVCSKILE